MRRAAEAWGLIWAHGNQQRPSRVALRSALTRRLRALQRSRALEAGHCVDRHDDHRATFLRAV